MTDNVLYGLVLGAVMAALSLYFLSPRLTHRFLTAWVMSIVLSELFIVATKAVWA